eukprot:SAG11_NODE_14989_length_592_cov_0.864097_1_plen_117_part_00
MERCGARRSARTVQSEPSASPTDTAVWVLISYTEERKRTNITATTVPACKRDTQRVESVVENLPAVTRGGRDRAFGARTVYRSDCIVGRLAVRLDDLLHHHLRQRETQEEAQEGFE